MKAAVRKILTSSNSDEWRTPGWLYQHLDRGYHFDFDPCSTPGNALSDFYATKEMDSLTMDWGRHIVYMNCPYSRVAEFMAKAEESARGGATVVCLVPSRPGARWFQRAFREAAVICWLRQRHQQRHVRQLDHSVRPEPRGL
jgi:phage N-6-adenine-methyltransferase